MLAIGARRHSSARHRNEVDKKLETVSLTLSPSPLLQVPYHCPSVRVQIIVCLLRLLPLQVVALPRRSRLLYPIKFKGYLLSQAKVIDSELINIYFIY